MHPTQTLAMYIIQVFFSEQNGNHDELIEFPGKTLSARAVANRTDACFIRVIGSELVQKYVGEGARMVRELFEMARTKKACLIFFDEIDAVGGARFDDGAGGDNEVQRTMLELINQGRNVFETFSLVRFTLWYFITT